MDEYLKDMRMVIREAYRVLDNHRVFVFNIGDVFDKDITKFSPVIKINCKGRNLLGHTAPFPEEIPEFAIRMFTYEGEKVLDPFAGSCTSLIVAKKLNRIGIGIEINKKIFRGSIIKNIKKHFPLDLFNRKIIEISEYDSDEKKIKDTRYETRTTNNELRTTNYDPPRRHRCILRVGRTGPEPETQR